MSLGVTFSDFIYSEKLKPRFPKERQNNEYDFSFVKSLLIVLVIVTCWLVILARLIQLQIFQRKYYFALANQNRTRTITIHAPRGHILDRNGVNLANNIGVFRLKTCALDSEKCQFEVLNKEEATKKQLSGLNLNESLETDAQRTYVSGNAFGLVLGYVSEISEQELTKMKNYNLGDRIGRGGLEEQYESFLKGQDGKELIEVDAFGKVIRSLGAIPSSKGQDIKTFLDSELQNIAYRALSNRKGAVVISNPQTGAILALVSSPSFDPNIFTQVSSDTNSKSNAIMGVLNSPDELLFSRAVAGSYPPGSTFKIITSIAALETKSITPTTTVVDTGVLIVGPYKYHNWKYLKDGGTQGTLNVVDALRVSNDIFFYKTGEAVGLDNLEKWSQIFGLGNQTGIDLPNEATGVFPTKMWREANAKSWYLGDTYHLAIGQGSLLVNPLQVNQWTNVIANKGKLCKPKIVSQMGNVKTNFECKELGIQAEVLDIVRQGMIEACATGGTAWPLFDLKIKNAKSDVQKLAIACKTGTAEFGDPKDRTHAWLTAYLTLPREAGFGQGEPDFSITVIVEAAGEGSDVAAPVIKTILEEWLRKL